MNISIVFNELCLLNLDIDQYQTKTLMSQFIETIREILEQGLQAKLFLNVNFYKINLSSDYPLAQWLNDPKVDQGEKDLILSLQFFEFNEIFDDKNEQEAFECENYKSDPKGLIYAYKNESLCISLETNQLWNKSIISLLKIILQDEKLIEEYIEVKHASNKNHVIEHQQWIQECLHSDINNGLELWKQRNEIFPYLEFCQSVRKQLANLSLNHQQFRFLKNALEILNNSSRNWQEGSNFKVEGLDFSGESQSTLEQYWKERTFLCPDGEERTFEFHAKLKSFNCRIYIYPLQPQKVYVGYIGKHLSTAKYKT